MRRRLALLALLAVAMLVTVVASTQGAGTGPPAGGKPAPSPGNLLTRYRVVGCRSHGDVAYLHGPRRREVAIGFDDGPWSKTAAFVRMLERNRAPATFFMIGDQVNAGYRTTLLRELHDGDVLGDHTFTHPYLTQPPTSTLNSRGRSG